MSAAGTGTLGGNAATAPGSAAAAGNDRGPPSARDGYKWVALSNTTLGMLMATIDGSIVIISMPAIFRGIGLDPLRRAISATCCG